MRERLKMMIAEANVEWLNKTYDHETDKTLAEYTTDHLLANGVIVPPCKVGDKTHLLLERVRGGYEILESKCVGISENAHGKWYSMFFDAVSIGNSIEFHEEDFGKTVFLTREEAEKALKGAKG